MFNEPHLIITDPQLVQKILTSYDSQGVANLRAIAFNLFGNGLGFNYEFNSLKVKSELAKAYEIMSSYNQFLLLSVLIDFFSFVRKLLFDYNIRYNNSLKVASKILENLVIEHQKNLIKGKDLLSLLVKVNEVTPNHEKLIHNKLVNQLHDEIIKAFSDQNHQPTLDKINQLKYLKCIFKKTLRIIPPTQIIHSITTKDEAPNDYIVPK
ncbi:14668_t:CDS:2, partial [Gigaspora margarita]